MASIYDSALGYGIALSYRDVAAEVDALLRWSGTRPTAAREVGARVRRCVRLSVPGVGCARRLWICRRRCVSGSANAAAAGVTLDVINADMRDFETSYQVDLAVCMISSLSSAGFPTQRRAACTASRIRSRPR